MHHRLFISVLALAFAALTAVMLFWPRTAYSQLEKRELATFPEFSAQKLADNTFSAEVSEWFSDSEPFRDEFMTLSMKIRDAVRLRTAGNVTFHATGDASDLFVPGIGDSPDEGEEAEGVTARKDTTFAYDPDNPLADAAAKKATSGIIIAGDGPDTRALMIFGGSANGGGAYIKAVNRLATEFPDVRVFSLTAPLASEFYTPDNARKATMPQKPFIDHINSGLVGVTPVHAAEAIAPHTDEPVYLRTDHHWAPLGAYYAAREFARTAGVPFADISTYTPHTIHRFVGSMYGYSQDISLRDNPEDFVFYTPNGVDYTTTYVDYTANSKGHITHVSKPYSGDYFLHYRDGSGLAYNTFMGGDLKTVRVVTSTASPRRLLVIKDSYGNAIPGYLFHSFGQIHVIDFRYFTQNLKEYVDQNGITDILVVFNVFNAYSGAGARKINAFLTQTPASAIHMPEPKPVVAPAAEATATADTVVTPVKFPAPAVAADTVAVPASKNTNPSDTVSKRETVNTYDAVSDTIPGAASQS